jgi:AraC-like DNA-binding protein
MKPYFEKVAAGPSSFTAFQRSDPRFPFYWHYHPEFELTLIVDSHGQRLVGDGIADYGPGDLVLLGPNVPHSWRSGPVKSTQGEVHRAVVVQFREDFLGQRFFELKEMESVARLLRHCSNGLAFGHTETGAKVAKYLEKLPSVSPSKQLVLLLTALVDLASEPQAQVLSSLRVRPICRPADQQRIDAICVYLNEHFEEEIEFEKLSERFHMDQASLCRFFKRATGRTMTAYLNELRVGAAAQLLINTDESVLDIAFRVGFGNYSNFNRQFKRIKGFGPRTLRRQFSPEAHPESRSDERDPALWSAGAGQEKQQTGYTNESTLAKMRFARLHSMFTV